MLYDCVIVGGGIAGLQAAIQLGRYTRHQVLVVDAGEGRSTICRSYHNVLGWPDGISGEELRSRGRLQAGSLGVQFADEAIVKAESVDDGFRLTGKQDMIYSARTVLLATGVMDRFPHIPGLVPCLGITVYVCPDCDGFEVQNRKTVVLGSGEVGANMAFTLRQRTADCIYVNHERKALQPATLAELKEQGIAYYEAAIAEVVYSGEGEISGVRLEDGRTIEAERGFIAFGGNEVRSDLARQLGVERLENKHVVTDPRSKMTNVPNVWCAGDVAAHAEQLTVAMGEGSIAAIWIHKALCAIKENAGSTR